MPRGSALDARLLALIDESPHEMLVVYPVPRPVATGTAPGTGPLSPLTGPRPTAVIFPSTPTPSEPSVVVPCLWYDAVSSVMSTLNRGTNTIAQVGWRAEATVVACVKVSDAVLSGGPTGKTVFSAADHVVHDGLRYRVLGTEPLSRGWGTAVTVYVYLVAAEHP